MGMVASVVPESIAVATVGLVLALRLNEKTVAENLLSLQEAIHVGLTNSGRRSQEMLKIEGERVFLNDDMLMYSVWFGIRRWQPGSVCWAQRT